jgi:RNA polymerase sigma-70 factor, ECF subfamily
LHKLRCSPPKGDRISDHHLSFSEEAELVRQLLSHDEHAFSLVVRAYQGKMLRLARALVGEALAEEVVQETWLAVLKALPDFEGRARLKTWILHILCNIAKSQLRREARSARTTQWWDDGPPGEARFDANDQWRSPPCPWQEETPEALLKAEELRQCIESAIAALPPAQQAVLTLRDLEGLAMDEICNILEISPTNGRVLLHRARARLSRLSQLEGVAGLEGA